MLANDPLYKHFVFEMFKELGKISPEVISHKQLVSMWTILNCLYCCKVNQLNLNYHL